MSRRLLVLLTVPLLLIIGIQWRGVTPVFASSIDKVGQLIFPVSRPVKVSVLEQPEGVKPSIIQGITTFPPTNGFAQAQYLSLASSTSDVSRQVVLSFSGPGQVGLSDPITFSGYLRDLYTGTGIPNKTITFSIGSEYLAQTHTNDQGIFLVKINKELPAGKYLVVASFKGAHLLAPSLDDTWVEVLPATVRVETVPAIAGITFQMDGRQFVSGADGTASININQAGNYRLDVLLDKYQNPSQQVEFGRWTDATYQPYREVTVTGDEVMQVGLNVFHKVSLKFVDLDGFPVDPSRISSINIRSVQGDVFTLKPNETTWLPASRTARRQSGLDETDLLYSLNSVMINGSNVVNSAQQRFYARSDDTWTITLLLYSLHITARDGLFASPVGTSVDLVYPDGQITNYPLNKSGSLEIHALARGIYHVSLVGVKGLGTTTPVALSRNQVVKLNIVSPLDVTVVGAVLFSFAMGLIVYGRPRLVKKIFTRKRSASHKLGLTPKHET